MGKQTSCMTNALPDSTYLGEDGTSLSGTFPFDFDGGRFAAPLNYLIAFGLKARQLFAQSSELVSQQLDTFEAHDCTLVQRPA